MNISPTIYPPMVYPLKKHSPLCDTTHKLGKKCITHFVDTWACNENKINKYNTTVTMNACEIVCCVICFKIFSNVSTDEPSGLFCNISQL